jgi:hypothetical protein
MDSVSICPDVDTLQRFLLGWSADDEAGAVEQHIELCDQCLSTLHNLQGRDSVVEAIQSQTGVPSEASAQALRGLAERLKQLRPAGEAWAWTPPPSFDEATVPPPDAARVEATDPASQERKEKTEELCHFLAPGQAPGELGRLSHYQVRQVLGSGGMGVVFQAFDPHLERLVALKAMLPSMAARPSAGRSMPVATCSAWAVCSTAWRPGSCRLRAATRSRRSWPSPAKCPALRRNSIPNCRRPCAT